MELTDLNYKELTPELVTTLLGLGFRLHFKLTDLNGLHEDRVSLVYVEYTDGA